MSTCPYYDQRNNYCEVPGATQTEHHILVGLCYHKNNWWKGCENYIERSYNEKCTWLMYQYNENIGINSSWFCRRYKETFFVDDHNPLSNANVTRLCLNFKKHGKCALPEKQEQAEREAKREAEEKALFDKNIADCTKQIQLNPNGTEAAFWYGARGSAYYQRKDFKEAIDNFNEAIRLDPKEADYYAFRGSVYYEKEEYDHALINFNEAIRINPNCKNAYWFRAMMYNVKGNLDKSISDYEEALRIEPNDTIIAASLENAKKFKEKAEEERKAKEESKRKKKRENIGCLLAVLIVLLSTIIGGVVFYFINWFVLLGIIGGFIIGCILAGIILVR